MLTRRCRGRTLLLRPSKETNQIVKYVVAVMEKRWGIEVHAIEVLGNHWHVVVTDPLGHIVEFQHDCHQFIARALNVQYGDEENVWNSKQTSWVKCADSASIIDKIAYTMANCVEARLVRYGKSWPGVRLAWPCKPQVIKRPRCFFRGKDEGGNWPDEAVLELSRPPGYDELTDEELAAVIDAAIHEREERFRKQYDAEGRPFLGRKAVLAQSRHAAATSPEPLRRISPTVAGRDPQRRMELLEQDRRWRRGYYEVLPRWRAGERDVVFPYGTYKMRVVHGARVAGPPD